METAWSTRSHWEARGGLRGAGQTPGELCYCCCPSASTPSLTLPSLTSLIPTENGHPLGQEQPPAPGPEHLSLCLGRGESQHFGLQCSPAPATPPHTAAPSRPGLRDPLVPLPVLAPHCW